MSRETFKSLGKLCFRIIRSSFNEWMSLVTAGQLSSEKSWNFYIDGEFIIKWKQSNVWIIRSLLRYFVCLMFHAPYIYVRSTKKQCQSNKECVSFVLFNSYRVFIWFLKSDRFRLLFEISTNCKSKDIALGCWAHYFTGFNWLHANHAGDKFSLNLYNRI